MGIRTGSGADAWRGDWLDLGRFLLGRGLLLLSGGEVLLVSWTEQINCDICGKKKGDVNHWWLMSKTLTEFRIHRWNEKTVKRLVRFGKHLCGQECVIKAVNEYLGGK